jgi:hypothetical protein
MLKPEQEAHNKLLDMKIDIRDRQYNIKKKLTKGNERIVFVGGMPIKIGSLVFGKPQIIGMRYVEP